MIISTKIILKLGVFLIIFVLRPKVLGTILKREQLPDSIKRFPAHERSQVSFTPYSDVPMLTLEEIKQSFPWLKNAEIVQSDRPEDAVQGASKNAPKYVFYYVPSEVSLHTGIHHRTDIGKQKDKRKTYNHKLETTDKESGKSWPKISESKKSDESFLAHHNMRPNLESEDGNRQFDSRKKSNKKSKSKFEKSKIPGNHKYRDREYPVDIRSLRAEESRRLPNYFYPKTPSLYMQPPGVKYLDKEFWVENKKRKLNKPIEEKGNEERLKNHRIERKPNKLKNSERDTQKHHGNHRPMYDREHDPLPEELTESSNGKAARIQRRPIEEKKKPTKLSQDGERIDFQIHGHEGPQTYIFGYDTGNGENRHFRLEERLRDGSVKGHYGYYDAYGKLKMVEYKASPMNGYEEKHHDNADNHKFEPEISDVTRR